MGILVTLEPYDKPLSPYKYVSWWHEPKGCLGRESMRDASVVRLNKVSKTLLMWEIHGRKDGLPEGIYSREGDA
jgi:hypothetical protein